MNSYPHEFLSHPLPLMFVAGISQKLGLTTSAAYEGITRGRTDSVVSDRRFSEAGSQAEVKEAAVVGLGIQGEQAAAQGATSPPTEQPHETEPAPVGSTSPPPPLSSPPTTQPAQSDHPAVQDDPFTTLESNLRRAFSAFSPRPRVWKEGVRLDRASTSGETSATGSRRGSREDDRQSEREKEERGRLFRILVVDKNFRIPSRKARPPTAPPANPSTITTSPDPNLYPSITTPVAHSPLSPLTQGSPTYPDGIMNPSWIRKHEDHVPCVIVLFLRLEADAAASGAVAADGIVPGKAGQEVEGGDVLSTGTTVGSGTGLVEQGRKERDEALVAEISERRKKWTDRIPGVKVTVVLLASKEMLADDLDDFVQRRKRAKLPANPQAVPYPATAPHGVRPLGTQGWAARYDWKAGYWAEGRGDVDLARRYRLFAELLEIVVAHGLAIHAPLPVYAAPPVSMSGGTKSTEEVLVSAVKPLLVLQNPGYYYYTAGNCAVQRKIMFEKAVEGEVSTTSVSSTAMANEKKVDHTGIIIELYTKAYDLLQARPGKNRLALYVAYRIAETHNAGGQYDLAMTFLRKIAHVYEEERWNPIVWSIRSLWYDCAQRTGTVDDAARLLLEMMAPYGSKPPEDPRQYQDDLDVLLKTTAPSTTEPIKVIQPSANALSKLKFINIHPLVAQLVLDSVKTQVGFLQSESIVNVGTTFMVELYAPSDVQFEELAFSSFSITFSNGQTCEVKHTQNAGQSDRAIDLGEVGSAASPREGNLLFSPGDVKRFRGTIKSAELGPLALDLKFQHDTAAFISETVLVTITATSSEERDFALFYEVEAEEADIEALGDSQQTGRDRLSRQEFGIIPAGASATKEITLQYQDIGEQQLRINFFATLPDDPTDKVNTTSFIVSNISISVPFVGDSNIRFEPSVKPPAPLLSSKRLEPDFFDEICRAIFYTRIYQKTPVDLTIHNIEYTHLVSAVAKLATTTVNAILMYGTSQGRNQYKAQLYITRPVSISRRSKHSIIDHYIIPTPPIKYTPTETIQAVVKAPTTAKQHSSFQWSLEITNLHPTIPASNLIIQTDVTEGFSWTGSRHVNAPMLVPLQRWKYTFSAIPMTGPGLQSLPKVRLLQAETEVPREIAVRADVQVNSEGVAQILVKPL
ncbi:hypothetical protein QFC22_002096 [Naganishia vaughanmartiniae]|uniref:Uncharacterized protein n=1 Tax=Naganishia vaughanmartiniae TaxID=1424756 RepID=A0ACC2XBS1_9TREE|nr:hypothetical protein QFC22_002096 [Naganishia vaughanmartiniae]